MTKTGELLGKTAARHTSEQFIAFLTDLVANQPTGKAIHVIADNLSAHKTNRATEFLQTHSQVHQRWLRLFGQFLPVHKWYLANETYAATCRVGRL